jgi:hypothetical protein
LLIFSPFEPAYIFSLISHLSIKPSKAKRQTYKHSIRVYREKCMEKRVSWTASTWFIFTEGLQLSVE